MCNLLNFFNWKSHFYIFKYLFYKEIFILIKHMQQNLPFPLFLNTQCIGMNYIQMLYISHCYQFPEHFITPNRNVVNH